MNLFRLALCLVLMALSSTANGQAFPINSDVAIQPAEGQLLHRVQATFRESSIRVREREVETGIVKNVFVYGWTSRFSTLLAVPAGFREIRGLSGEETDYGFPDARILLRYQIWKKLGPGAQSRSITLLGGAEIPTFDSPFSSRSVDPIGGAVFSWRKGRYGFDADAVVKYSTENDRDFQEGTLFRYDLASHYRLLPGEYTSETKWSLSGLLELNGEYQTESEQDGRDLDETDSHQIFLGPGLVLAGRRVRYELGVQIPVFQDVGDRAREDDFRVSMGFTWSLFAPWRKSEKPKKKPSRPERRSDPFF